MFDLTTIQLINYAAIVLADIGEPVRNATSPNIVRESSQMFQWNAKRLDDDYVAQLDMDSKDC